MSRRLVAIGNTDRGDDAAGWEVARTLTGWEIEFRMAGSIELIADWNPDDDIVIVDAMRSGEEPGSIHRFDALSDELPRGVFTSTHSFGPASLVELAKVTGHMPRSLVVYGIEAKQTDHGSPMSPEVAYAV
ncbi:MAG: hydrogenase maturation protease, partial [Acidimicrobiia bacterium]